MADSLIRWKKGDYIKLGQAVSRFNKRIKELEVDELSYLPDMKDYKEIKENILSRKELNRVIKSLREFSKEGSEDIYTTSSGEELTRWEYSEIRKARNRGIRSLKKEAEEIEAGSKFVGMGDERLRQIEATIESLLDIENRKGSEFKRTKERLLRYGETDIKLKQAQVFKDNFLRSLEELESYDNVDKLKKKLSSLKNPIKFYEFISQSDVLSDLFIYYKDKATSQTYGGFADNQDAFNYALEVELEIDID